MSDRVGTAQHRRTRGGAVLTAITLVLTAIVLAPAARAATPPANDQAAHPTRIATFPTVVTEDTSAATTARTEPHCVRRASVWFSFTPRQSVTARLVTIGTRYDAVLAVFRGTATNANLVGCGDDEVDLQAALQLRLRAGTRYLIAVSSYDRGGPTSLHLYAPAALTVSELTVTSATVGEISGQLTLTGTIRCSTPSMAFIDFMTRQVVGPAVAKAAGTRDSFPCLTTTSYWKVQLDTVSEAAFQADRAAAITMSAFAFDGWQDRSRGVTDFRMLTAAAEV